MCFEIGHFCTRLCALALGIPAQHFVYNNAADSCSMFYALGIPPPKVLASLLGISAQQSGPWLLGSLAQQCVSGIGHFLLESLRLADEHFCSTLCALMLDSGHFCSAAVAAVLTSVCRHSCSRSAEGCSSGTGVAVVQHLGILAYICLHGGSLLFNSSKSTTFVHSCSVIAGLFGLYSSGSTSLGIRAQQ